MCVVFLITSLSLHSQNFSLGKVTLEELKEKSHPLDSTAPAAILFKRGNSYFTMEGRWQLVTEVEVRIKIYKKEGYGFANISVPYYAGINKGEDVTFSDAVTYNLSGDKIVKTKLKDNGVFTEEVSKTRKVKKITLPNVVEGSVIEYKYIIKSPFISQFPDWYFQSSIPVNNIGYTVTIPQFLIYNRILSSVFRVNEKEKTKRGTMYYAGIVKITFNETSKNYLAQDIPAFKDESHIDNIKNYLAFVKHEFAGETDADGNKTEYATDWQSMAKSVCENEDFGGQLKDVSFFEQDIKGIVEANPKREDLVLTLFNYVKNRIAWNGYEDYECWGGVKEAYNEKTGNTAEINLMLVSMLRHAGLRANPVLLSTRANGHAPFASIFSFNYVIAAVESDQGIILLDATDKNALPDVLPLRALNVSGRLIREDMTSQEVSLLPQDISLENTQVIAKIDSEGAIDGQVKSKYQDYNALVFRDFYKSLNGDEYAGIKEKALDNIEITAIEVKNDKECDKPIEENFAFKSRSLCDVIGDKIYVSPLLMFTTSENPFKQEERLYPIDFIYPHQDKYSISITIPEGYKVESVPQPVHLSTKDNMATFKLNIASNGNQIQVVATSSINVARVNPEYYETIKEFYGSMIQKLTEKIVLKKA